MDSEAEQGRERVAWMRGEVDARWWKSREEGWWELEEGLRRELGADGEIEGLLPW